MELVNTLSWSATRARTLSRCARLYYLRYYLFWKGWEPEASSSSRLAYALSKMSDLPVLVGEVVHDLIASNVRALREGRVRGQFERRRDDDDAEARTQVGVRQLSRRIDLAEATGQQQDSHHDPVSQARVHAHSVFPR